MKITVRKLATQAQVSPATVSRYINNRESISPNLAKRIEDAMIVMGGSPVARRTGPRKKIVMILLTHLRLAFYSRMLAELLEREAFDEYTFILLCYNPLTPETIHDFVRQMHPVGVLYFEEEIDSSILRYFQNSGLRTVMCGGVAPDCKSDRVHVNDIAAAYEGTRYLLELGHKEILFLSDDEDKIGAGFQRMAGSRRAMEERGIALSDAYVFRGGITFEAGYQAIQKALSPERWFSAIFAFSDELAVGAMAALYDAGLRVPEDVSVLGYDDMAIATRVRPALTTIHQPIDAFVQRALDLFRQPPQALPTEILLPHRIIERQSCRRIDEGKK